MAAAVQFAVSGGDDAGRRADAVTVLDGRAPCGRAEGNRLTDAVVRPVAARMLPDPRDLLVHCAQAMNHLAGFLPALFSRFANE